MYINFVNPGEIEIDAVTTLGVNAKSGNSPIGFFGTGLKFAIATLIRNGQSISIWSGEKLYTFTKREFSLRDKTFSKIVMQSNSQPELPLGFTIDLGRNWTLADAYRELYSNCMDEGGSVSISPAEPSPGHTIISVSGAEFFTTHHSRDSFILNTEKLKLLAEGKTYKLQVYEGASSSIFYRGIKVLTLEKPTAYTYNILSPIDLTEDRTAKYDFQTYGLIQSFLTFECENQEIISTTLVAECLEKEKGLPAHGAWSETFTFAATTLAATFPESLSPATREVVFRRTREITGQYVDFELSPEQKAKFDEAIATISRAGTPIMRYPFRFVESCGANVIAIADQQSKTIFLARPAFLRSDLISTILEEFYHLDSGFGDCTRWFQDHLLAEIERLTKTLAERPLPTEDSVEF